MFRKPLEETIDRDIKQKNKKAYEVDWTGLWHS